MSDFYYTDFFKRSAPYCFKHLILPKSAPIYAYLPLNRWYKPLGYRGDSWVDYLSYVGQAWVFKESLSKFKDIWVNVIKRNNGNEFFLYDDSTESLNGYMERVAEVTDKMYPVEVAAKLELGSVDFSRLPPQHPSAELPSLRH